jgi:hypothetical protein
MLETISGSIMVTPLDAREEVCLEAGDIVSSTMPEEADLCPMTELRATGRRPSAPGANPDAQEMAERTRAPVRAFLELLLELPALIGVIILIEMTWLFSLACSFSTVGFQRAFPRSKLLDLLNRCGLDARQHEAGQIILALKKTVLGFKKRHSSFWNRKTAWNLLHSGTAPQSCFFLRVLQASDAPDYYPEQRREWECVP